MVHLTTVVGGTFVRTLPLMLRHYEGLGVRSFFVNVQLSHADDPAFERVKAITDDFGIDIASVTVGPWNRAQKAIYAHSRLAHRDDWFILADQDEFHAYDRPLDELLAHCDARGYDYVTGCLVDRLTADGSLPPIDYHRPLDEQFPVRAFVSYPLSGCDPRKVVAARAHVNLIRGQHYALNGRACPMDEALVPVHHFKWVEELGSDLMHRAELLKSQNERHWTASARIVAHLAEHDGRIDVADERFLASFGGHEYERWSEVSTIVKTLNDTHVPQPDVY